MGSVYIGVMDREIQTSRPMDRSYPWDKQKEMVISVSRVMETSDPHKASFPA